MKQKLPLLIALLIFLSLTACSAQKIIPPQSGPTAQLTVKVSNFAKRGMFKAENVWIKLYNQDESWGAEPVLVEDHASDHYIIPAQEDLKFSMWLQQGGPGYEGGCSIGLNLNVEKNSNLLAEFTIKRVPGEEFIAGCKMTLSNNGKLVGEYEGKPDLTFYKVKVNVI